MHTPTGFRFTAITRRDRRQYINLFSATHFVVCSCNAHEVRDRKVDLKRRLKRFLADRDLHPRTWDHVQRIGGNKWRGSESEEWPCLVAALGCWRYHKLSSERDNPIAWWLQLLLFQTLCPIFRATRLAYRYILVKSTPDSWNRFWIHISDCKATYWYFLSKLSK